MTSRILCLLCLCLPSLLWGAPRISEFLSDNTAELADQDGAFSDWIEVHNPGPEAVNLEGYGLTDDPALPLKWKFPSVPLAVGERVLVFASGKNRAVAGRELHANFQLSKDGEYLALTAPGGENLQNFAPYPPQNENQTYGVPERLISVSHLSDPGSVLVPATAEALPANWNQPSFAPVGWGSLAAPPGAGFDTGIAVAVPVNISSLGSAVQSTTFSSYSASLARNNILTDFTQTLASDTAPFWQLNLTNVARVDRVNVRNRGDGANASRLRDISVDLLDANGGVLRSSGLLNPENAGYPYPTGPALLTYDLVALSGTWVEGVKSVRVRRTADPDLSGTAGQGTDDEKNVLSMAEVEVIGISGRGPVNLARSGSPAPLATQTSTFSPYTASLAIDGNTTNFTQTGASATVNQSWTVNLRRKALISSIVIYNRPEAPWRLRDLTVTVLDSDGVSVLYASPLLNPENTLSSPAVITVDPGAPVYGQYVRVLRTRDPDWSGQGGIGTTDDISVLAMAEVVVNGSDASGIPSLLRTDLRTEMANVNASAFFRIPFTVGDPSLLRSMALRMRYDDGFVVWLNGVKVAERNAPASLEWNAAATANRSLTEVFTTDSIDLTANRNLIRPGQNWMAVQGLNSSAADPEFLMQPDLVCSSFEQTPPYAYLEDATPRQLNNSAWYIDETKDTVFSHKRGFHETPFQLNITSATPGAQIFYTTNNSDPSPVNGFLVNGPISITGTSVIRARAYRANYKPTNIDTHTFIFLNDVTNKPKVTMGTEGLVTGLVANIPAGWPVNAATNGGQAFNWGFDTGVKATYTPAQMRESLTQLPIISVVTEQANLTNPNTGIYVNGVNHGDAWERPGSIEMLDYSRPGLTAEAGHGEFALGCGLRIRGGASRGDGSTKHSFRVFFRKAYGEGKLAYRLYGANGAAEFENFDLRGSQNYSWSQNSSDPEETMVRDPFARITLGAMGQPYTRSRYCHLFLNGLYWGIYDIHERAENSFGESYLGGNKTDYDSVKCGDRYTLDFKTEATDGYLITNPDGTKAAWKDLWDRGLTVRSSPTNANYFRLLGRNPDGTRNPAYPVLVDIDNLIDYMLVIFYTGDGDATLSSFLGNDRPNNWFSLRDRKGDRGFTFYCQDGEHTLLAPSWGEDRTGPFLSSGNSALFDYSNPQWVHDELSLNPEYRLRFADHLQKHCFNGGALDPNVARQRWIDKAAQINKAIRVYAARYSIVSAGEKAWTAKINSIRDSFFKTRNTVLLAQLRTDRLWPTVLATEFSQFGGLVPSGYQLTMKVPAVGTVYYSMDGSDPRSIGTSTPAPGALTYSSPVTLTASGTVSARVLSGTTWSPLLQAYFGVAVENAATANLNITEISYHPAEPVTPAELAVSPNQDEFEFIEIANVSATQAVDLNGVRFTAGITTIPLGHVILQPGEHGVFVKNAAAFAARYGTMVPAPRVLGVFTTGNLSNSGETVTLSGNSGDLRSVTYSDKDPWPAAADGLGQSLALLRPSPATDHTLPANWRASATSSGTPGQSDAPHYRSWKNAAQQNADTDDADGDGLSTLLEYALGTSPVVPGTSVLSAAPDAEGYLVIRFQHDPRAVDVVVTPEISTGLSGWSRSGLTQVSETLNRGGTVTTVWKTISPISGSDRRFVRVAVNLLP